LPALGGALAALTAYSLGHYTAYPGYAAFLFAWGIAAHSNRRTSIVALLAVLAGLGVALGVQPGGVADVSAWTSTLLATSVAWLAGRNRRNSGAREDALAERAALLEQRTALLVERSALLDREREQAEHRTVVEERLRIARELHDVVAHSMSVVAVQSGMASLVLDSRPDQVREALTAIEATSRGGLIEMRRLLGVLRQEHQEEGEDEATLAPAPRLADVPALIDSVRGTGLQVELDVEGSPRPLQPAVELTAYRLVQEALTNVVKHGGPAARVRICHGNDLAIEVTDDGTPDIAGRPALRPPGGGHGIGGMRARVRPQFSAACVTDEFWGLRDAPGPPQRPAPAGGTAAPLRCPRASGRISPSSRCTRSQRHDRGSAPPRPAMEQLSGLRQPDRARCPGVAQ
jgi:signal transduction histidine kinase